MLIIGSEFRKALLWQAELVMKDHMVIGKPLEHEGNVL